MRSRAKKTKLEWFK